MQKKIKALIWDIDLTLSDGRHRHHLIDNWEAFVNEAINDTVFETTLNMLNIYEKAGYATVLLTARGYSDYDRTIAWLEKSDIRYTDLFMKDEADKRPDEEVKKLRCTSCGR